MGAHQKLVSDIITISILIYMMSRSSSNLQERPIVTPTPRKEREEESLGDTLCLVKTQRVVTDFDAEKEALQKLHILNQKALPRFWVPFFICPSEITLCLYQHHVDEPQRGIGELLQPPAVRAAV